VNVREETWGLEQVHLEGLVGRALADVADVADPVHVVVSGDGGRRRQTCGRTIGPMVAPAGTPVALVLAAGKSERLGEDKLLRVVDGKTIIERTLATFTQCAKIHDVLVVIAPQDADKYAWLKGLRIHVVENPHPDRGMISSIRTALSSAWALERDFLIHPADVPFVKTEVVDRIVREFAVRGAKILLPVYKGLGGHPGMYAAALRRDFFSHGETHGAREIIARHRDHMLRLSVHDPDVCFDVDTPEDLRAASDPSARWARVERDVEDRKRAR
jgi:molybdenum cofactor cytidylyltransferase